MARKRLKVFRVEHGLSQCDFAEKIGYSRGYYRRVESGECTGSLRFWQSIADVFGYSLPDIMELTEIENS